MKFKQLLRKVVRPMQQPEIIAVDENGESLRSLPPDMIINHSCALRHLYQTGRPVKVLHNQMVYGLYLRIQKG